jgi:uncharacterized membrane protein
MAALNATELANTVNGIIPGNSNGASLVIDYLVSLPSLISQGDYFAMMISLILLYAFIYLFNKISGLFLVVINRTIALVITFLAATMIYNKFMANFGTEGLTINTILIGAVGLLIGGLGIIISFYSLFRHTKKAIEHRHETKEQHEHEVSEKRPEIDLNHLKEYKTFFSLNSLKNDKSLLSVLTFLVVAEFGVFSSNTISAPNPKIGLIIFGIFVAVSFLFIKQSYRSYAKGLTHIVVTFVLGIVLAFVLGHYWANIPFETLFSVEVFSTDVLVALISGMALSLFAGSKG